MVTVTLDLDSRPGLNTDAGGPWAMMVLIHRSSLAGVSTKSPPVGPQVGARAGTLTREFDHPPPTS